MYLETPKDVARVEQDKGIGDFRKDGIFKDIGTEIEMLSHCTILSFQRILENFTTF